jgi:hypothetical protein
MSDNDKDATESTTDDTQEIDMSATGATDGGFDKSRQQIQQEIGNKLRPLEERLEAISAQLEEKPLTTTESGLADDDYVTAAEARQMNQTAMSDLIDKVTSLEQSNQTLHHQTKFQSKFPGQDYQATVEEAFALAREDNPGVDDGGLSQIASSYMNRIGRQRSKSSAPVVEEAHASTDKKAPDSAKGAKVTTDASVSPSTKKSSAIPHELSPDEVNAKYGFDEVEE